MLLKDLLVSYNLVEMPKFEFSEPEIEYPTVNNYDRATSVVRQEEKPKEDKFDWNMGLKGRIQELVESTLNYDPKSIKSQVNERLKYYKFDEEARRAILGNFELESAFKKDIISKDGHNSYGLAQWTGPRKEELFEMYGKNPSIELQVDFLVYELNGKEKRALAALRNAKGVEAKTEAFMRTYERPHKDYAALDKRIKYALS